MNLAIISDVHDNLANLEKFLFWAEESKIDALLCCGDLTNAETLEILASKFKQEIYLVQGNCELFDAQEIQKYSHIKFLARVGHFKIANLKIGACHEPFFIDKVLEKDCDFVFYGHTHKPWVEERAGVQIINPGTLGGVFQKACFAVLELETKKFELKILERI